MNHVGFGATMNLTWFTVVDVSRTFGAAVAELEYALALGASSCKGLWVRIPPAAPNVRDTRKGLEVPTRLAADSSLRRSGRGESSPGHQMNTLTQSALPKAGCPQRVESPEINNL